jgi:predicted nucleic acid-binding protein
MFVLDTNIVSELRRTSPHAGVLAWLKTTPESGIFISAVTVGEIQAGIERTRDYDLVKAEELERWLVEVVLGMSVLPSDAQIFRTWARLMHKQQGHLSSDAMIAATALCHGVTVATRNVADFERFKVPIFNPFEYRAA